MDETIEYIEQCRSAKKIQTKWNPKQGDYVSDRENNVALIPFLPKRDNPFTWLPKQDQLQKMIFKQKIDAYSDNYEFKRGNAPTGYIAIRIIYDFRQFVADEVVYLRSVSFDSMEQLWLAFIMYTKYDKRWDCKNRMWV